MNSLRSEFKKLKSEFSRELSAAATDVSAEYDSFSESQLASRWLLGAKAESVHLLDQGAERRE